MITPSLHYIHDPLCGWCYGAAPLVRVAREILPVRAHAGGMMTGAARRPVTSELRQFVMTQDRQIAQASGQPFGTAYTDGLLHDTTVVLDSGPPITAILAAEDVAGVGLDMLARLQVAHYMEGRRIADFAVLLDLALALGLDAGAFTATYHHIEGAGTQAHIAESRRLLTQVSGQGFPTFAIESDGQFTRVDIGSFLGQPEAWRAWLNTFQWLATPAGGARLPACGLEGCTL